MTLQDIANARLHGQMIARTGFKKPEEVVRYLGAMQAQDFPMSKWAAGLRMAKATDADIQQALDDGRIIRTHLMRPTWHLVCAEDLHWMLELTAPQILQLSKSYWKQRNLTEDIFKKSNRLIVKTLEQHECMTREDLKPILEKAGLETQDNALSHYMSRAELDMLICSGSYRVINKHTPCLISVSLKPNTSQKKKHWQKLLQDILQLTARLHYKISLGGRGYP